MPDRCQTDARQTVHYAVWRRKLPTLLQATQTEEASIKQNEYDAVNAVNAVNTVNTVNAVTYDDESVTFMAGKTVNRRCPRGSISRTRWPLALRDADPVPAMNDDVVHVSVEPRVAGSALVLTRPTVCRFATYKRRNETQIGSAIRALIG